MSSDLRKAILENISIEELLREEGFEVIPRGRKLTVKGHDSLVITPDKGVFTWNSRGFAGSVIDLYMGLHGCDARTAMTALRKRLPEYSRQHAAGPEPGSVSRRSAKKRNRWCCQKRTTASGAGYMLI